MHIEEAKEFAIETINKLEDKSRKDFLLVHSEKVGQMADLLARKIGIESDVFRIAGWLHDIGNIIDNENHAEHSMTVLRENDIEVNEVLMDCIVNHGDKCEAKTLEGRIFQVADKLSVFDVETIEVFIKHGGLPMNEDYIGFLKMLSKSALVLLKEFKK